MLRKTFDQVGQPKIGEGTVTAGFLARFQRTMNIE
jgi:hypothetical protein